MSAVLVAASAVLGLLGAALPWANPSVGNVVRGWSRFEGKFIVLAMLYLLVVASIALRREMLPSDVVATAALFGVLATVIALFDLARPERLVAPGAVVTRGLGAALVLVAGGGLLAATVLHTRRR